jgi:pimeloyl-ACP methyl ester carboxylesterase
MPTLIVWGTRDRVFPKFQAQDAVACINEGYLELIPDCGHLPHIECPEPFVAAVERFSAKVCHR